MSLSADGNTALIGARQDDDKGNNSGSAYVFARSGGAWTQQAKITASDSGVGADFGTSVSLSAEGSTALIGADYDNDKGTNSGSAYIFELQPQPKNGLAVFDAVNYSGTNAARTITSETLPHVDMAIWYSRNMSEAPCVLVRNNNIGASMETHSTGPLQVFAGGPFFDVAGGLRFTNGSYNSTGNQGAWLFRRARGFFDYLIYTTSGSPVTCPHNLGVRPHITIEKNQADYDSWWVTYLGPPDGHPLADYHVELEHDLEIINVPPLVGATDTTFTPSITAASTSRLALLFAPCRGVCDIGIYTGNGSTQTINCGFSTGATAGATCRATRPG